jgi:hypothetical protein
MPSTAGRPPHENPEAGFWARWSPLTRHGVALALLLVLSLGFFAPVHFGGQGLHGSDVVQWKGMAEAMVEYEEATGEDALWAPNLFGGMPGYLVNYGPEVPQLDTLVTALRSVAWPTSHFFLLLAGVYFLVFYLTRNQFSSLLAAAAYGLTTYLPIILAAGHQTKFVALAYAPYVLLAFAYALRNPGAVGGLLFAGALSLELRAKHPQITYYVLMLALVWWVVEGVRAYRSDELAPFAKSTGWLAGGTALALLMVVQPYWATYQYKQFSTRAAEAAAAGGAGSGSGSAMGWDYAMRWSQGPGELVTLAIADAYGGGPQLYWGPKPFTSGPHYVGGAVLALAGLALWKVRTRIVLALGIGAGATAAFALGRHLSLVNWPMFQYFPFFDSFRSPETWLSITVLALVVLAGVGLDYVLRRKEGRRGREPDAEKDKARQVLIAFGAVLGVVALLYGGRTVFFDFEKPGERQQIVRAIQQQRPNLSVQNQRVQQFIEQQLQQRKTQRTDAFEADALRTMAVLGVVALLLWLYRRKTIAPWLAGGLVVLVVVIDLWGVDRRYLGDDEFSPQPDLEAQMPETEVDRWVKKQVEAAGGPGRFRVLPLQTPYAQGPMNQAISSYHYESIGGYHGAKLQRYQNYIDHILQLPEGRVNENALDLLNTRYVIARQRLPNTRVAYRSQSSDFLVLRNPDALPRGFFVGQTEVVDDARDTWERLRSPSFDPRQTALLDAPIDGTVTPLDSTSSTSVTLEKFTPREIRWTVETDAPRLFVASEIYYPAGWTAALDGEEVPIHATNYLLRGVHVPAGEHTLTMRFDPAADRVGTWIAAVATAVDYGGLLWLVGVPFLRRRGLLPGGESDGEGEAIED